MRNLIRATSQNFMPDRIKADYIIKLGAKTGKFSVKSAYENICPAFLEVSWAKILWFKGYIPRFDCITCLHKGRLSRSKLKAWGVIDDDSCGLCGANSETIEDLFFSCPIAYEVWRRIMEMNAMYRRLYPRGCELA